MKDLSMDSKCGMFSGDIEGRGWQPTTYKLTGQKVKI